MYNSSLEGVKRTKWGAALLSVKHMMGAMSVVAEIAVVLLCITARLKGGQSVVYENCTNFPFSGRQKKDVRRFERHRLEAQRYEDIPGGGVLGGGSQRVAYFRDA